jgi:hypothetical protein
VTLPKFLRWAVLGVLLVWLSWPIVELFVTWDKPVDTGNDTQYSLIVVGLTVGMVFVFVQMTQNLPLIEAARVVAKYLSCLLPPVAPFVSFGHWAPESPGPPFPAPDSFAILRI